MDRAVFVINFIAFTFSMSTSVVAETARIVDIVDLVVDAKQMVGKYVTVEKCQITGGGTSFMSCKTDLAEVYLDTHSIDSEALKRSIRKCHQIFNFDTKPECTAGVSGQVSTRGDSVILKNVKISFEQQ